MRPVDFEGSNSTWKGNGGDVIDLPVYKNGYVSISCWQVTWREWLKILFTGKVWHYAKSGSTFFPVFLSGHVPEEVIRERDQQEMAEDLGW